MDNRFTWLSKQKLLFTGLMLFLFCMASYAQNIKKVYRNLKKEKIEKVSEEMVEFTDETTNALDTKLWEIAASLVVNNKDFEKYDPYKALSLFEDIKIQNTQQKEIHDFLEDYDYDLNEIKNNIFVNILEIAKASNTEKSYKKALSVCENCFYYNEALKLKEQAAYEETISSGTLSSYKYYLWEYRDGLHSNEILGLLTKMEFDLAVSAKSITELEKFIRKYSTSKYKDKALFHRDSLVLIKTPKTFEKYSSFLKSYPSSHFAPQVKDLLPNLLYSESTNEKTIVGYKKFIAEFPEDNRVGKIRKALEQAYVKSIREYPSLPIIKDFRDLFPESLELDWINQTYSSLLINSDWNKQGLKGNVKEILFNMDSANGKSLLNMKKQFDRSGRMTGLEYERSYWDQVELIENQINPIEFDQETQVFTNFGILSPSLDLRLNVNKLVDNNSNKYILAYNSKGLQAVKRVETKRKSGDKNVENAVIIRYNKESNLENLIGDSYEISYSWDKEKLISKIINYNDSHTAVGYFMDYSGNNFLISLKSTGSLQWNLNYKFDGSNRIVERKTQVIEESHSVPLRSYTVSNFKYDAGNRVVSVSSIEFALNYDETLFYPKSKEQINVIRDEWGNIIKCSRIIQKDQNGELEVIEHYGEDIEWEYIYDEKGNWISRTRFDLQEGSRLLKGKVEKVVIYYEEDGAKDD